MFMIQCWECDGVFQDTPGYESCPCGLYARRHHAMCCTFGGTIVLSDADRNELDALGISDEAKGER